MFVGTTEIASRCKASWDFPWKSCLLSRSPRDSDWSKIEEEERRSCRWITAGLNYKPLAHFDFLSRLNIACLAPILSLYLILLLLLPLPLWISLPANILLILYWSSFYKYWRVSFQFKATEFSSLQVVAWKAWELRETKSCTSSSEHTKLTSLIRGNEEENSWIRWREE